MIACGCASPECAVNGCALARKYAGPSLQEMAAKMAQQQPLHSCNCIGPQHGAPRCPCQMRNIIVRDGRFIQREVDLGPAPKAPISGSGVSRAPTA